MTISITLTAYNMGNDATEADFDAWAAWVAANIDEALGLDISAVDQFPFRSTRNAQADDEVSGATEEQESAIKGWLSSDGWEAWCASTAAVAS